jgi:hypothetical protein
MILKFLMKKGKQYLKLSCKCYISAWRFYAGQYETWQPRAFLDEGHLYSFRRFLAAICFHGGEHLSFIWTLAGFVYGDAFYGIRLLHRCRYIHIASCFLH